MYSCVKRIVLASLAVSAAYLYNPETLAAQGEVKAAKPVVHEQKQEQDSSKKDKQTIAETIKDISDFLNSGLDMARHNLERNMNKDISRLVRIKGLKIGETEYLAIENGIMKPKKLYAIYIERKF
jgi:hypothetical protein